MPVEAFHRFTVEDYHRMGAAGVLRPDARVELLGGRIIDMSPIGPWHGGVVSRLTQLFIKLARDRWWVTTQNPLRLDEHSEPEPDVMLCRMSPDDYTRRHPVPEDVLLLVEVADASLDYDRGEKLPRYGRAEIPEVWIVNLEERVVEVYREPHYEGYGSKTVLAPGGQASPQAFPDVMVNVSELLGR